MKSATPIDALTHGVIQAGLCTGCGACIALDESPHSLMQDTHLGPIPAWMADSRLPLWSTQACPGLGVNYPDLYQKHYGHYPNQWLLGEIQSVWTGHASDPAIRRIGASGGVLTQVLVYLLETGKVDAVILAQQGRPTPEKARAVIAQTPEAILAGAQSIYIPVSMLDLLKTLEPQKTYAITCLPEQSAALRVMQQEGFAPAMQVQYVVGLYTGTALYPAAISCFLRSRGIREDDSIQSLKWRAGEWPGYLEIKTESGRIVRSKKVYYNFLIPFYITQTSLQSMDFVNEFADLSVGDAWSPVFEAQGVGHSIIVARTQPMASIIAEMEREGWLSLEEEDPLKASDMHGHMLDFKKRGGYLRNQWRRKMGRPAPDYGYRPAGIPLSRVLVEIVISSLFVVGRTAWARWVVARIPESIIGPVFNTLRLGWKKLSRPTKRKGLGDFHVDIST